MLSASGTTAHMQDSMHRGTNVYPSKRVAEIVAPIKEATQFKQH